MLFLKKRQKIISKQNSQVGGFYFPGTAFNYKSNGTNPHWYLSCVWRNYQNNFKNVSENRKTSCYF